MRTEGDVFVAFASFGELEIVSEVESLGSVKLLDDLFHTVLLGRGKSDSFFDRGFEIGRGSGVRRGERLIV